VEIPTHPREGVDLGALAQAIGKHNIRACWFMTSFQNPLGATMPQEKKRALVKLLADHEIPLIEDDVYGELYFGADRPRPARKFYAVIAVGLALGLVLDYAGFNAVSMLFWSAVLNGVLAPPLIVIVLLLTTNRKVMRTRTNPRWLSVLGWITVAVMTAASAAMFATWKS